MVKDVIFTLDGAKHLDVTCAALLSKTVCFTYVSQNGYTMI